MFLRLHVGIVVGFEWDDSRFMVTCVVMASLKGGS